MATDKIIIIGAGMAGLLAGNMLRRHPLQIVERQSELPNNHHGVLRFRSTAVSDQTHIPFRQVRVFKGIAGDFNPIQASMLYAQKVIGKPVLRSILSLEPSTRYIAPTNFIGKMAEGVDIAFGVDGLSYCDPEQRAETGPVISTLPMPLLMDATGYDGPRPTFEFRPGWSFSCNIPFCDAFATFYHPAQGEPLYRSSLTGDKLTMEYTGGEPSQLWDRDLPNVFKQFGIDALLIPHIFNIKVKEAEYAKLAELSDDDMRKAKDFMFWATTKLNIFSLGRFATWRHNLLLDDVVHDVMMIERWLVNGRYEMQKAVG